MKIPRSTSTGVKSGHRPAWYTWFGTVMLVCPSGHVGMLRAARTLLSDPEGHEIAVDGTVTPSAVCPEPNCTFHEHVVLQDWIPFEPKPGGDR